MKILSNTFINGVLLFSVAVPLVSANEAFHKDDANCQCWRIADID